MSNARPNLFSSRSGTLELLLSPQLYFKHGFVSQLAAHLQFVDDGKCTKKEAVSCSYITSG